MIKIIKLKEAKELKLKEYFTGIPCSKGHICKRVTSSRACSQCSTERTRKWRASNFEHIKKYSSNYHKTNPEIKRISEHNRSKRKSSGRLIREDILNMFKDQKGLCAVCRCDLVLSGYHIDHKIPLSRNGLNIINNIQLLCPTDNVRKNALTDLEYLERVNATRSR